MKKCLLLLVALICLISLAGCGCEHEWLQATGGHGQICNLCGESQGADEPCSWVEATCETPKKCAICGKTEGEALGHNWNDAICDAPKTCARCGETEGEALSHSWNDATCDAPKTCAVCSKTEGDALGHSWKDATCHAPKTCATCAATEGEPLEHVWVDATCETPMSCALCGGTVDSALGHSWTDATCTAPKTCTACGKTEGEALGHSWDDATGACTVCGEASAESLFSPEACKDLFGHWEGAYMMTGEMMGDPTMPDMPVILAITFRDDGTFAESVRMQDKDGYTALMKEYYMQALYAEFELNGLTKEQADEAMLAAYGMDVAGYSEVLAVAIDWEALLATASHEGVYYVADGMLYSGDDWDMLVSEELRLENNTLTLSVADVGDITLSKVS